MRKRTVRAVRGSRPLTSTVRTGCTSTSARPTTRPATSLQHPGRSFDLLDGRLVEGRPLHRCRLGRQRPPSRSRSAVDDERATKGRPIIGFLNGTGFRVWVNGAGMSSVPTGFTYGKSYSLKMMLNPTSVTYYIDDKLVYTSSFSDDPEMASRGQLQQRHAQAPTQQRLRCVLGQRDHDQGRPGGHEVGANHQVLASRH